MCRHKVIWYEFKDFWDHTETVAEPYILLGTHFRKAVGIEGVEVIGGTDPRVTMGHTNYRVRLSPKAILASWVKGKRYPFTITNGPASLTLAVMNVKGRCLGERCPDCGAPIHP